MKRNHAKGQGITEYAVIMVLIALAAIAGLLILGAGLTDSYRTTLQAFQGDVRDYLMDDFEGDGDFDWQSIYGECQVRDGKLFKSDRYYSFCAAAVPDSNYTLSLEMQTVESRGQETWDVGRVVFRFKDTNNYYGVVLSANGNIELVKRQNGIWQASLAWAPTGKDPKQLHAYQIKAIDNHIEVWMDGEKYMDYTDPNPLLDGGIGFGNDASVTAIDNVEVVIEK